MTNEELNAKLPPKTCTIERLVTKPDDVTKVLNGMKTATRRNGRYADIGEVMELDSHKFVVEHVYRQPLEALTENDALKEGFADIAAYKTAILDLHPGMKWVPKMNVWVHEFSPIEEKA